LISNAWYESYPLRFEKKGDVPIFSNTNELNVNNRSRLSPITNIVLNVLSLKDNKSNFIISIPSSVLRPIPLISYILAKKSNTSILVFSGDTKHYNKYHLIKRDYQFIWNDIPAGELREGSIRINPYIPPYAKRDFKSQIKRYIPLFKDRFLRADYSKVLFCHNRSLKMSNSIQDLFVGNEKIVSELSITDLGIKTIIFENLDNIIYNDYLFNAFKQWIEPINTSDYQFIFHFANPNYKFLQELRELFKAYVMYFPYSFLKSNEDLYTKNKYYFNKLSQIDSSKTQSVLNSFNLEQIDVYLEKPADHIQIKWKLKKGNVDIFFGSAMELFSKLDWRDISKELIYVVNMIKQLFFKVYRAFCIPKELTVRFYDENYGFKYYHLQRFFYISNKLIEIYSSSPSREILKNILMYLVNFVNELSECKRYGEPKSYTRIGKNYTLCDFLDKYTGKEPVIIGVQRGEKKALVSLLDHIDSKARYSVKTVRQLSRSINDHSGDILILSGNLLPSNIQILFKNWKKIIYLVYEGNNQKWVKRDIKLISKIDISKEELTLKYLSEIIKELIAGPSYDIQKDPLFSNFLKKKKKIIALEANQEDSNSQGKDNDSVFDKEVSLSTTTIMELCRDIMKSDPRFKQVFEEEKAKRIVKKRNKKNLEKFHSDEESLGCTCDAENEINGNEVRLNLDIKKRYMYFTNRNNIKIEYGFPYTLKINNYIVLFGKIDRLSVTDFIKDAFEFEDVIDYNLIKQWQGNLAMFYYKNYKNYSKLYKDFILSSSSTISYQEFIKWVKGEVNAPQDPNNLYHLGALMNDSSIIENYASICEEGKRIQRFNQKITNLLKKLVVQVLDGKVNRQECTFEELGLLEKIEHCIFKIKDLKF